VREPRLLDAYLERLTESMSLPDADRRAAAEEIAAPVEEAVADQVGRNVPRDLAERQALERLGAPERLADDLTAARRNGSHVLAAAGTALRVSILTGLQYFLFTWAVIVVVAVTAALVVTGVGRILGTAVLQGDWTLVTTGLLPAIVACAVAYGIGSAILTPVAVAARRPAAQVRRPLVVIGAALTAWIAIAVVAAPFHVWGVLVMLSAPAWFVAGLLRQRVRSAPILSSRVLLLTLAILVVGGIGLAVAAGGSSGQVTSGEAEPFEPIGENAAVGPFAHPEHPPVSFASEGTVGLIGPGAGPLTVERTAVAPMGLLEEWRDVRLEVWPGPPGPLLGPALDPDATEPLATGPMTLAGRRLSGSVEFLPRPDREHYYVAITGLSADGVRTQLAWPDVEWWRWEGTVVDFVRAWIDAPA
jgi:hypothetical protein